MTGTMIERLNAALSGRYVIEREIGQGGMARPGRPEVGLELSPDGSRLAVKINTDAGEDIWVKELDDGPLSRLSFDPAIHRRPGGRPTAVGSTTPPTAAATTISNNL